MVFHLLHHIRHFCVRPQVLLDPVTHGCGTLLNWVYTDTIVVAMRAFCVAVKEKRQESVTHILQGLLVTSTEDNKPEILAERLCSGDIEKTKEVLMISILSGNRPLVEFVLQLFHKWPEAEFTGCSNSTLFPSHLTPIMLACLANNFSIVQCLLLRGHTLQLPHRQDLGRGDVRRMDAFRAACSDAFLWLATSDPLLASMHLLEDLRISISFKDEFKEVYNELYQRVHNFTVGVVQHCWSFEEVDLLLSQKNGARWIYVDAPYPRVFMALEHRMKPFIAHMNVQSVIQTEWKGKWTDFGFSLSRDSWRLVRHVGLFWLWGLTYSLSCQRWCTSFNNPIGRFVSHTAAYLFVVGLMVAVQFGESEGQASALTVYVVRPYLGLFFLGFIVQQMIEFWKKGLENYFTMWWKWMDFVQCYLLFTAFILGMIAFGEEERFEPDDPTSMASHPTVYFNLVYGAVCLLTVNRVLYNLQLLRELGSTIISTERCIGEVMEYVIITGLVMLAFALSLNMISVPYEISFFSNVVVAFRNLFWGFYAYLPPTAYTAAEYSFGPATFNHVVTLMGTETLVAFYFMATVATLLKLLVSFLVDRAQRIKENEEIEWKFTRVEVYSNFLAPYSAIPPPFNLIHLLVLLVGLVPLPWNGGKSTQVFKGVNVGLVSRREMERPCHCLRWDAEAYQALMVRIFRRFIIAQVFRFRTSAMIDKSTQQPQQTVKTSFLNAPLSKVPQPKKANANVEPDRGRPYSV